MQETTATAPDPAAPVKHVVRLRDRALDRQLVEHRVRYRSELCRRAGVQRTTLYRIERGDHEASAQFIAGVLAALPSARFEDLFEVVRVPGKGAAA